MVKKKPTTQIVGFFNIILKYEDQMKHSEEKIRCKIHDINTVLINDSSKNTDGIYGNGKIIFYYKYALFSGLRKDYENLEKEVSLLLERTSDTFDATYANGFFGNIWLLTYLEKVGFIKDSLEDSRVEINQIFDKVCTRLCEQKNYDFFHGLLGLLKVGAYSGLIEKPLINNFVLKLLKDYKRDGDLGYFFNWFDEMKSPGNSKFINLGISHGISSIPSILLNVDNKNPLYIEISNQIINCILKYKNLDTNNISLFPAIIDLKNEHYDKFSRLAWCYGDLGIGCNIWNCGQLLKNNNYKKEAIEIMIYNAKRRDLIPNRVLDAGICHGTSGIAHIFNRFYTETGIEIFAEAKNYWIDETLKMAQFEKNGMAGYKTYDGAKNEWKNDTSFLEGVAGIGIVLLDSEAINSSQVSWDHCLLIS